MIPTHMEPAGLAPDATSICDGELTVRRELSAKGSADLRDALLKSMGISPPIRLPDATPKVRSMRRRQAKREIQIPRCRAKEGHIRERVAEHYGLSVEELIAPTKAREVSDPRQVGMYLARKIAGSSLTDAARAFGRTDHTTARHAVQQVEKLRRERRDVAASVEYLEQELACVGDCR